MTTQHWKAAEADHRARTVGGQMRPTKERERRSRIREPRETIAWALSSNNGRVHRAVMGSNNRWQEFIEPWAFRNADDVLAALKAAGYRIVKERK